MKGVAAGLAVFVMLIFNGFSLAFGQQNHKSFSSRNAVYAEILGNGYFYSLNYDRVIYQKGTLAFVARAGFCYWASRANQEPQEHSVLFPVEVTTLYGKTNHHLELGIGTAPSLGKVAALEPGASISDNETYFGLPYLMYRLGYRYQKPAGGFFFRIGYLPYMNLNNRAIRLMDFTHGGISIGKSF